MYVKIKKQEDIRDCGLYILQAFHNRFYNKWVNINHFKEKALYGLNGINIMGLESIAKEFGMSLNPMKGNIEAFNGYEIKNPNYCFNWKW